MYGDGFEGNYRLAMAGIDGVGKSSLTVRHVRGTFLDDEPYPYGIEEEYPREAVIDGVGEPGDRVPSRILDVAIQEEYRDLRDIYWRDEEGFMLVYSITDRETFEDVVDFHDEILGVRRENRVAMVLVGNKADLEDDREVEREDGQELADRWEIPFFEASARTDVNVEEAYFELVRQCERFRQHPELRGRVEDDDDDDGNGRDNGLTFGDYVVNFGRGIENRCCNVQ